MLASGAFRIISLLAALGALAAPSAFAASVTFDGDDFASAIWIDSSDGSASATIGDFLFEATGFDAFDPYGGSIYLWSQFDYESVNTISVSRADGQSFAVTAISFFWGTFATQGGGFSYYDEDGNYQSCDYCYTQDAMSLIAGDGLANISNMSVFAYGGNAEILLDSVTVSDVVPIPSAVWLFGSALIGLGFVRKRHLSP